MVVKSKKEIPMYEVEAGEVPEPNPMDAHTRCVVEHYNRKAKEYKKKADEVRSNGNKFKMLFSW